MTVRSTFDEDEREGENDPNSSSNEGKEDGNTETEENKDLKSSFDEENKKEEEETAKDEEIKLDPDEGAEKDQEEMDSEEVKPASDVSEEMTESEGIKHNTEESEWEDSEGTVEGEGTEPTSEASEWMEDMGTVEGEPTSEKGEWEGTEEITEGEEELKPLSTEGEEEDEKIMAETEDFKSTSKEGDMEGIEESESDPGIAERQPTIQELLEEIVKRGTGEYEDIVPTKGKPDYIESTEEGEPGTVERQPTIPALMEEIFWRGTRGQEEFQPGTVERQPTVPALIEEIVRRGTEGQEEFQPATVGRQPTVPALVDELFRRGTRGQEELQPTLDIYAEEKEAMLAEGDEERKEKEGKSDQFQLSSSEDEEELIEGEFQLSFVYLMTFTDKFKDGRRELIVRGNDLYPRKGRRLRDRDMRIICAFLAENPVVVSVDLAYNEITDKGIGIIAKFLRTHDSVRRLNVMGNNIGAEGIKKLAELGDELPLESLRVNGNMIGVEGGKSLAAILDCSTRLRHLDMAQTNQTLSSLAYISTVLHYNTTLQFIDLSRPLGLYMHALDSAHWAEALGQSLRFNATLQELHLQKSDLIDHDVELLLLGMKYNNTLLLLDLSCNQLGNHSLEILGPYLKQRPALIALILGHNRIGDLGARCLSFTMPFSKIQLLDLSYNRVTDIGLGELLTTVKKTVRLRAFYIWGNPITQKSYSQLARLLRAGVLQEEWVDFKLYTVDGEYQLAFQNVDRSRHIYYCVGDFSFPQPRPIPKPRSTMLPTTMLLPRIPFSAKYAPFSPSHPRLDGGPVYLRRHPEETPNPDRNSRMSSMMTRKPLRRLESMTDSYTSAEGDVSSQTDVD